MKSQKFQYMNLTRVGYNLSVYSQLIYQQYNKSAYLLTVTIDPSRCKVQVLVEGVFFFFGWGVSFIREFIGMLQTKCHHMHYTLLLT